MIQVRRRADLKEEGTLIPFKMVNSGKIIQHEADQWMWASQPDSMDNLEWNMLIFNKERTEVIALAIAIDFDFGIEERD